LKPIIGDNSDRMDQFHEIRNLLDNIHMAEEIRHETLPSPNSYYSQYKAWRSLVAAGKYKAKNVIPKLLHGVAPSIETLHLTSIRKVVQKTNFIHDGCVLFVKSVKANPSREPGGEGVELLVEDGNHDLIQLWLYNYVPRDVAPEKWLPIGTFLAALCPYPRKRHDGMIVLRCDNPECIIRYHSQADWEHEQAKKGKVFESMPDNVGNSVSSDELRRKGNNFFVAKDYFGSIYWYMKALDHADDDLQAAKILCNLSAACFELDRFEEAEKYAFRALLKDKDYVKARYRQGRALLWLQRPQDAINVLKPCKDDLRIHELLTTCNIALEEKKGTFNIKSMISEVRDVNSCNFSKPFPFHADFQSPKVAVGTSLDGKAYRGCKALSTIEEGELLLASRAFTYAYRLQFKDAPNSFDFGRNQCIEASSIAIIGMTESKLRNNPDWGEDLYSLSDGMDMEWDETNSVNLQRIMGIILANSFGGELITGDLNIRHAAELYDLHRPLTGEEWAKEQQLADETRKACCGLWLKESMFNHSCTPNCDSFFVGPHMLTYAVKRIEAGEELCISYCSFDTSFAEREEIFASWNARGKGFICQCDYCTMLRSNSELQQMHMLAATAFKNAAKDVSLNNNSMAIAGENALPTSKRYSIFQAHKNIDLRFQHSVAICKVMDGTSKASRRDYAGALKSYEKAAEINYAMRGIGCLADGGWFKDICRIVGASLACNQHQRANDALFEVWTKYYDRFFAEKKGFILLVIKYSLPWWSDDMNGADRRAYQLRTMAEKITSGKKTTQRYRKKKGGRGRKCRGGAIY